jgi:YVTN family beta-propeller protein
MVLSSNPAEAQSLAYVTNRVSDTVSVIDTASNIVIATVTVGGFPTFPTWVGITPDGSGVYVTNLAAGTVSVIDTSSNTVADEVLVGGNPVDVAITSDGTRAYVTNVGESNVSVIDTGTNTVVATINPPAVGSRPFGVATTPDGAGVYVTNQDDDTVSVIDTATGTLTATVLVGSSPQSVAITPTPLTARDLKKDAISELQALVASIKRPSPPSGVGNIEDAEENLNEAITFLTESLESFDPGDSNRLIVAEGKKFFDNEEDAVEEIFDAIESGEITNTDVLDELQNICVNKILEADKIVAGIAIEDAFAIGGDTDDIADANEEFMKAQQQIADGVTAGIAALEFFDDAVSSLQDAWENAQEAIEEVGDEDDGEDDDDDSDSDSDKDSDSE